MTQVLGDPGIGGFTVARVLDEPEHRIRREIDDFLADRGPDDMVLLYLSCHGLLDARGRLFFAATDTRKTRLSSSAIESAWLLDRLDECRARRQILILDCCFSGAFDRMKGTEDIDLARHFRSNGRGRVVLTASRAGEYSFEGEPAPGHAVGGSVFTSALLDGLRTGTADRDDDGFISVDEAYDYAAGQIAARGGKQTPQRWIFGGEGTLILARNPRQPARKESRSTGPPIEVTWRRGIRVSVPPYEKTWQWLGRINDAAISPDGRLLALAVGVSLQLWDARTGQRYLSHQLYHFRRGGPNTVRAVTFSPDGRLLAVAARTSINLKSPAPARDGGTFLSHRSSFYSGPVAKLAFSPDGRLLAAAHLDDDHTVRLWDPAAEKQVGPSLRGHTKHVECVTFSPDGRILVTAADDETVRAWDPKTGHPLDGPVTRQPADSVAFSGDGRLLGTATKHDVRLWDPATLEPVGTPLHNALGDDWGSDLMFCPDGRQLAVWGSERLWFWYYRS